MEERGGRGPEGLRLDLARPVNGSIVCMHSCFRSSPTQVSSKDEDFLDLSVDVEQNTSITHCLRYLETPVGLVPRRSLTLATESNPLLEFAGASATRRRYVANTSTTVSSVEVSRKHRKGEVKTEVVGNWWTAQSYGQLVMLQNLNFTMLSICPGTFVNVI